MIKLGDYNTLTAIRRADQGFYLEGDERSGDILLPNRYVPHDLVIGKEIEVFVYLDQDERLIATTEHPAAKVGEFASLEVAWINKYGAFLKWGLMKDLFCPFRLGFKTIINNRYQGQIYDNQIFQPLHTGDRLTAYIDHVRQDGKIDITLQPTGRQHTLDFAEVLLRYLYENNGRCDLGDKSDATLIYDRFKVSKKAYKKAVGDLYRRRLITISEDGIDLA